MEKEGKRIKIALEIQKALEDDLELKIAVFKCLLEELVEQVYINKLNVERDM